MQCLCCFTDTLLAFFVVAADYDNLIVYNYSSFLSLSLSHLCVCGGGGGGGHLKTTIYSYDQHAYNYDRMLHFERFCSEQSIVHMPYENDTCI